MAGKKNSSPAKATGKPKDTPSKVSPSPRLAPVKPVAEQAVQEEKSPVIKLAVKKKSASKRPEKPIREGLSLDRKLDILGVALALIGFLTLLSYLAPLRSSLTGGWVAALKQAFGLGMYVFPFGLMIVGLWLVLRNFERIPQFAMERMAGLLLLFFNLTGWAHYLALETSDLAALDLARAGRGGGFSGAFSGGLLHSVLGSGGAAIALVAWLVVALALSLDITILEMARSLKRAWDNVVDYLIDTIDRLRTGNGHHSDQKSAQPALTTLPRLNGPAAERKPSPLPGRVVPGSFQPSPSAVSTIPGPAPVWVLPSIADILDQGGEVTYDDEQDLQRARIIEDTLSSFGAPARVVEINRGPTITQFGVEPDYTESRAGRMRVRVGKITALADDLALALAARTIRIQAPVPGKGFVGIEVPNEEIALVAMRDIVESQAFQRLKSPLRFALGLNVAGNAVATDLAAMPHLLIAGATGSGKSVCVNAIICCLLLHNTPDDLRLLMVDPKRVELTGYNGIPHLLAPVVVELERVIAALQWVTREMDLRYRKLAEAGCRNIQEYNARQAARNEKKLPFLVVIIDELADLMMLAPDETERTVTRLAQLARATGIHLVIATQRPSVDVVTGLIKANFPARIAFAVASGVDSRVILDQPGAERLLGRGDMLFQAPDAPAPVRLQGVFVSEAEIQNLVSYWQGFSGMAQAGATAAGGIVDSLPAGVPLKQMPMWEDMQSPEDGDPLLNEAIDLARRQGRASISMLQRRLRIGYTRAARLIETMEERGIVGPPDPSTGARDILDYGPAAPPE